MTDRHIHLLRAAARRRQRDLDDLDADPGAPQLASSKARQDLARAAARAQAQLVAAQLRRRRAPDS